MKLVITPSAEKALTKLPKADAAAIRAKLAAYVADPAAATNVKQLVGRPLRYRLRHGDWRALFWIEDDVATVVEVKHRREVYR